MNPERELTKILEKLERSRATNRLKSYAPYPFQKAFHNAIGYQTTTPAVQRALMAANQCLTPWTALQTDRGERQVCEMLGEEEFGVQSWDGSSRCTKRASSVFLKGIEPAFRVHLDNGSTFECSLSHRVLTVEGFFSLGQLIRLSMPPLIGGNWITKIEAIGLQPIIDFEVEQTHCYEAGGVIHHNSGKTLAGGAESAVHLTGRYPDWWTGSRFTRPIDMMIGGLTNESVKKICQKELFGEPTDDRKFGTGIVPLDCLDIDKTTRKAGVPDAYESVLVKHVSGGWSNAMFMAYEQGAKKHMGHRIDCGWLDEEPPEDIWSQYIRGTLATKGILFITFTPEEGMTKVVYSFMNELKPGQALLRATWDDAPHMNHERREQALMAIPSHQREMRSKGIPLRGSGLVYAVPEEEITCEPIEIPAHWPRICGVDFGIDHGFAAVWFAWDRDRDIAYLVDCWKAAGEKVSEHVSQLNKRGHWIPVAWPHDGLNREKSSGKPLADVYREEGANMYHEPFSNPPTPGVDEGKGGNSVEFGIENILHRMQTGRFKVFKPLGDWFMEWRDYHRDDGKIVKIYDDLMDATRYAALSLRHASTKTLKIRKVDPPQGPRNW